MTWRGFLWGGMRSKMSSRGKSEVNALLEMFIGGGDEALELNGRGMRVQDSGGLVAW